MPQLLNLFVELARLPVLLEQGSCSRSGSVQHLSASTMLRSVRRVERALCVQLFDSSSVGMRPTAAGEHVLGAVACMTEAIELAAMRACEAVGILPAFGQGFATRVTPSHIRALLGLSLEGSVRSTANALDVSDTSVTIALNDAQRRLGVQLVHRTAAGLRLTPQGAVLVEGLHEAMSELALLEARYRDARLRESL